MTDNTNTSGNREVSIDDLLRLVDENNLRDDLNTDVSGAIRHDILVAYSDTSLTELESGGTVDTKKLLAEMYRRCDGGHSDLMLIVGVEEVIRHFAAVHQLY